MATNPAEPGYGLTKLFQEIADLRAAVKRLEQTPPPVYVDQATVLTYAYPSTQCIVQYDSGATRGVYILAGYTPSPGEQVEIVNLPGRAFALRLGV